MLIVAEIRRQFRKPPGVLEGLRQPDYASPARVLTLAALRGMTGPGIIPAFGPVLVV